MRTIKIMIASLAVASTLVACGEGFKAVDLNSASGETAIGDQNPFGSGTAADTEGVVAAPSETPISVDQAILNTYMSELNGISDTLINQLASDVKAFQVSITSGPSSNSVTVGARLRLSCTEQLQFSTSVAFSQLASGAKVSLGFRGNMGVRVQCADNECRELVAAVTRSNTHTDVSVLYGMKKLNETYSGSSVTEHYSSRVVAIQPYFSTEMTIATHDVTCSGRAPVPTGTVSGGTTSVVNPTAGGVVTTGGSTTVVNPVATGAWDYSQGPL